MENITLEKIIKFDNTIVSLETLQVSNDLKYELLDDDTHAKGFIGFKGNVKTMLDSKSFDETVDVDKDYLKYSYWSFHKEWNNFFISKDDYDNIIQNGIKLVEQIKTEINKELVKRFDEKEKEIRYQKYLELKKEFE